MLFFGFKPNFAKEFMGDKPNIASNSATEFGYGKWRNGLVFGGNGENGACRGQSYLGFGKVKMADFGWGYLFFSCF